MNKLYCYIVLSLCFMIMYSTAYGTHVAGGTMTYRCLGNDSYEVSLQFRRDCFNGAANAQFDEFASIGIFNSFNQIVLTVGEAGQIRIPFMEDDTLNEILTSECNVIGGDVCVQTTTYRDTLILPSIPGGYILSYQRCCFNQTLNNVQDPLNTGSTIWVQITEEALEVCNNSPTWLLNPSVFICADDTLRFNHSAIDIDGDSLVYFTCAPSQGADMDAPNPQPPNAPPYSPVTFASGFSENNMMGGSPLSINSETGQLLAVPNQVGQFLIGICVREFRDGVLLSEVRRDFEYNVRVCGRDPIAIFSPEFVTQCDDLEVEFTNESTSNFLPVDSLDFLWLFDFPNENLMSTDMSPTFDFPVPGLYNVAMIVTDGVCIDTAFADVGVSLENDPTAAFDIVSFDCDGSTQIQLIDNSSSSQPISYEWTLETEGGGVANSTEQSPIFNITEDQTITVSLTVSTPSRCTDTLIVQEFEVNTVPLRGEFIDKIICSGDDVVLFSSDIEGLNVDIEPEDNVIVDSSGNYLLEGFTGAQDFIISIDDGFCFLSDTVTIDAVNDPRFPLGDLIQCGETTVQLNEFGPDFFIYNWEGPTGSLPINNEANPFVSLEESGDFFVTVSTSEGSLCFFTDTVRVEVEALPEFNVLPASQFIFCEGGVMELSLDQDFASIEWRDPVTGFILGADQNLTLTNIFNSTILEVVVVDDNGCTSSELIDVQFISAPVFSFDQSSNFNVCSGEDATLIADSPDNIVWTDVNDIVLGTGNILVLENLTVSTNVIATATNDLGCTSEQQLSVGVFSNPGVDFNSLDNLSICEGQVFSVGINTNDTVLWTDSDGNVLGNSPTLDLSNITRDTSFIVTITNQFACSVTETFEINIDDMIVPGIDLSPSDNVSTCVGNGIELVLDSNFTITYTDLDGNILSNTNVLEIDELNEMQLIEVTVVDERNCTIVDTFPINIFEGIGLEIEGGAESLTYCQSSAINLGSQSDVTADVIWSLEDGTVIGSQQELQNYMPNGDQVIVASATDQFGCMDADTILLVESLIEGNIAGDSMICLRESSVLTFTPVSDLDFQLDWSPQNTIIGETDNSVTVQPMETTTYTVIYINEDGCEAEFMLEVLVDGFFDGVNAFADPQEILFGESTILSTDQDPDFMYIWEPAEDLDDNTSNEPEATPSETATYMVTVTEDNGCTDTASVTVEVIQPTCDESDIFVPNMFTPNGDFLNDTWRIESNFIDRFELIVYNRWGEEVFQSSDQNIEWDGTFKNQLLEPDVYGYHLMAVCNNGFEYTTQGNVTIVK